MNKVLKSKNSQESEVLDVIGVVSDEVVTSAKPSIFANLANLRLKGGYQNEVSVKRVLTNIPVGKPGRQDFVRVHPGEDFRIDTFILELKEENEVYLVVEDGRRALTDMIVPATLYLAVNRQDYPRIWHVKLPGEDGRRNGWHESAASAACCAMQQWTRITANMAIGAYEVFEAVGQLPEPVWPDKSFGEILEIAFRGRIIDSADHPVVQRLLGFNV